MATKETAVAVRRENAPAPVQTFEEIEKLGQLFERSGMFGVSQQGQGVVLAMTCMMQRITPLEFIQTYHIVEGRPSMRSDAMLAKFIEAGGTYEIIERSPDRAAIKGTFKAATLEVSLSFEEAKQEPFVWGKEKNGKRELKDNYATPRKRMQMLWARVTSDMVRAVCPVVAAGVYTPEEVQDFTEDDKVSRARPVTAEAAPAMTAKPAPGTTATKPAATVVEPEVLPPENKGSVDYTIMPCGKLKGKPFAEMEEKTLKLVIATQIPTADQVAEAKKTIEDTEALPDAVKLAKTVITMSMITHHHIAAAKVALEEKAAKA